MSAVMERESRSAQPVEAIRIDSLITYPVTKELITELKTKYAGLNADTPKGFEECKLARAKVRSLRTDVEKQREILKAPIIREGKRIDEAARSYESSLREIEDPLDKMIKAYEAKKDAERKAKEDEERRRVEAELKEKAEAHERKLREEREAEEAKLKAERERLAAERKKMDEEKAAAEAERKRHEEEAKQRQAKIDTENAERLRKAEEVQVEARKKLEAEQRKLDEEKRAVEAARLKAEREEFQRQANIKAEQEAKEKAEAERIAKEKADAEHALWKEQERQRIEAIKPDVSKVHDFAKAIRALSCPGLKSGEAQEAVHTAMVQLGEIAEVLEVFQATEIPY